MKLEKIKILPPIKRYMYAVQHRLQLDAATRRRIMTDLSADVQSRLDAGESTEEIIADLGTPQAVADAFNEEYADHRRPAASPWRWALLAVGVVLALVAAGVPEQLAALLLKDEIAASVGIIGGADGPTAIFVTTKTPVYQTPLRYLLGGLAGFLLLGWCRRGPKQRLWLPIALCAVPLAGALAELVSVASLAAATAGALLPLIPELLLQTLTQGTWLCLLVLVWAIVTLCRRTA